MLRRGPFRRGDLVTDVAASGFAERATEGPLLEAAGASIAPAEAAHPATSSRFRRVTKRRVLLGVASLCVAGAGLAYQHKATFSAQGADLSRQLIGDERTARIESWYFSVQDRIDRTRYRLLGGDTTPFDLNRVEVQFVPLEPATTHYIDLRVPEELIVDPILLPPRPMTLPATTQLRDNPEAGEGVWTTAGLPRSSPSDILMAKTFIRPDKARPYASVGVLLMDSRRIRLSMVGGTSDPGGDRGVKGPGVIPAEDTSKLLVAWNGGFKGPHGNYGMVANGKEYRPLRNGLATIAVYSDGSIKLGEWGTDLGPNPEMVAARQNAVLLVKDGQVSKRVNEGNDTWGYVNVNSAEFITWRSAVGLTRDGDLIYAAGTSLSAATLAQALWAAGAYTAMQLDINSPYVLSGLYFPQSDATVKSTKFMDSMPDNPNRFLKSQERDFMYIVLDESHYN